MLTRLPDRRKSATGRRPESPWLGERVLQRPDFLQELGKIACRHKERLDGSGYHPGAPGTSPYAYNSCNVGTHARLGVGEPLEHGLRTTVIEPVFRALVGETAALSAVVGCHQFAEATDARSLRTEKRMGQRILVIGPNDSVDRIARVAQALAAKRPDLSPTTPAEILGGEQDWPAAYHKALRVAAAVVCVPRGDATVGSGTLHDLVEAHEAAVPVRVVSPRGRLLGLEEAGLEVIPKPRTNRKFARLK